MMMQPAENLTKLRPFFNNGPNGSQNLLLLIFSTLNSRKAATFLLPGAI